MIPFSNRQDRPDVQLSETPETIPDHAAAFAECLRRSAKQIASGRSAEDVANELLPVIRIAARRI